MSDERRERYAAAIGAAMDQWPYTRRSLADAAIAVADEEYRCVEPHIRGLEEENARLRAELERKDEALGRITTSDLANADTISRLRAELESERRESAEYTRIATGHWREILDLRDTISRVCAMLPDSTELPDGTILTFTLGDIRTALEGTDG